MGQPLNQVASWCIGEYADVLIAQGVQSEVIISTLNRLVLSHLSSKSTKSYAINAIAKLSNQQMSSEGHNLIRQNVAKYGTSMILELQQRSVEFSALFDKHDNLRPGVLEKMPLFEKSVIEATYSEEVEDTTVNQKEAQPTSTMDDLLGLDITAPTPTPTAPVANSAALVDLLGGSLGSTAPPPVQQPVQDILGGMLSTPQAPTTPVTASIPDLNPAWANDQLNIKFAFSREGNVLTINLEATNQTLADEITDFVFQ